HVRDGGEPGLAGWTIEAFKDTDGDGTLSSSEFAAGPAKTAVTGAGGSYSLTLDPGNYIVVEVPQSGWFQTAPTTLVNSVNSGISADGFAITLTSGQLDSGNDFGNMAIGRGALTPGFWCNHEWAWNGATGDEPKNVNSLVGPIPSPLSAKDILYPVDS